MLHLTTLVLKNLFTQNIFLYSKGQILTKWTYLYMQHTVNPLSFRLYLLLCYSSFFFSLQMVEGKLEGSGQKEKDGKKPGTTE